MLKKLSPNIFSILLILAVPVLSLWQVSFFAYTMKWDMMDQFFPCRYFMSECFREHTLPLWCPYINFGYPAYADPQGGFFYPVSWFISFFFGYNVYSIAAEFIFQIAVASAGFYWLLRSFKLSETTSVVFAISYSLSGIFISNATHLSWVISLAWMPCLILCYRLLLEKSNWTNALSFGLFSYLSLTGGYPGFFIIICYFFIGYTIFHLSQLIKNKKAELIKTTFGFLILSGLVALLLSSGYLYSLWQTMPLIERGGGLTVKVANTFPFSPAAMISFLFPFATTCRFYSIGTDVTMTNAYSGLLLLPFLLFAFYKTSTHFFQKAFLLFGIICLCASAGDSLPVRSWLYYLPGMNMFRHAAIFRGFAVLALLFFSASGFEWFLNSMKQKDVNVFAKNTFLIFAACLLSVFIIVDILNSGFIAFPKQFNHKEFSAFNENRNVFTHILAQSIIQLVLLSTTLITFLFIKDIRLKVGIICFVMIADMAIATQLNMAATVICEVNPKTLDSSLKNIQEDFVAESNRPLAGFSSLGNGSIKPIWYNNSFFKKIPAYDGFNNFQLKGQWALAESPDFQKIIQHPLCYFETSDSNSVKYAINKFSSNEIQVQYTSVTPAKLVLLQSNFPGWKAKCDEDEIAINKEQKIFMNCEVPTGNHIIRLLFEPAMPRFFFWWTVIAFSVVATITIGFLKRQQ